MSALSLLSIESDMMRPETRIIQIDVHSNIDKFARNNLVYRNEAAR